MSRVKKTLSIVLQILKYLSIIFTFIILGLIISLYNTYSDFKIIGQQAIEGKNNLNIAIQASQNSNWNLALSKSQEANNNFNMALEKINDTRNNFIIKRENIIQQQVNDLEYLIKTVKILNNSLQNTIPLAKKMSDIMHGDLGHNFSQLNETEKEKFIKLIYESQPELNGLQADLKLASLNLNKIHRFGILLPIYNKIGEFKEQLNNVNKTIEKIRPLSDLIPILSGYPNKSKFLIILQNNDELRPSGGFIGLYAILETKNGSILKLQSFDSYHLDMPAVGKWTKEPPQAIKKYLKVKNWYLRDANWSPDWPQSAKSIQEIYNGELEAIGKKPEQFTGIIAINPKLVSDLLDLVGTIKINGEEYDSHNFQKLLQYNVEIAYQKQNISSWDRKEIVNSLIQTLEDKLLNLPSYNWTKLINIINNNIITKDIQIYFPNSSEDLAKKLRASGEVKRGGGDYFLVVDANLGAYKSDAVMKKYISYEIKEDNNKLLSKLNLKYEHQGSFDWRTTKYRTYTRIYLPQHIKINSVQGVKDYQVSDDQDLNKTVLGFFWTINPGQDKEISINYELPKKIMTGLELGHYYELYIQKQSGNNSIVSVNINLNKKKFIWSDYLTHDMFFKFDLRGN